MFELKESPIPAPIKTRGQELDKCPLPLTITKHCGMLECIDSSGQPELVSGSLHLLWPIVGCPVLGLSKDIIGGPL